MSSKWEKFFRLRLDGRRYAHDSADLRVGLDLRDLEELISVREAIIDLAEYEWGRDPFNNGHVPPDFRQNISIRFFGFEKGSCIVPMEQSDDGPDLHEAARMLTDTWRSAKQGKEGAYNLPDSIVEKVKLIGSTRHDALEMIGMEVLPPPRSKQKKLLDPIKDESFSVTITSDERDKAVEVLDTYRWSRYEEIQQQAKPIEKTGHAIDGEVVEANRNNLSAMIRLSTGKRRNRLVQVKLRTEDLDAATLALHKNDEYHLLVRGTAELDARTGKLLRIKDCYQVEIIPAPKTLERLLFEDWANSAHGDTPPNEQAYDLSNGLNDANIDAMHGSISLDDAVVLVDHPSGPLAKKSKHVISAVREAILGAIRYVGDAESDMSELLDELHKDAEEKEILLSDSHDNRPGEGKND